MDVVLLLVTVEFDERGFHLLNLYLIITWQYVLVFFPLFFLTFLSTSFSLVEVCGLSWKNCATFHKSSLGRLLFFFSLF